MSDGNGDDRKAACLGCLTHGMVTPGAARGLFRSSRCRLKLDIKIEQSSLLTLNANTLWCWALNRVREGERVDYFAMLHADVEPDDWWLDVLVDELDATGLDVLGVVCPIKDPRGVTSIALEKPEADTWHPLGRLTMKEVYRLPETFTSADVGHKLLLNTGCWVCRFDESWAKKVWFTINDRLGFDPKKGIYFPLVESEDWFFSRLLHELNLKVGATRKVKLAHRGPMAFTNDKPWGTEAFDGAGLSRSVLDGPAPPEGAADWFPHRVPGWLTEGEGRELARLAAGKAVLEIGAYCGRSTICLAQQARSVASVDTFDGRATPLPGSTFQRFQDACKAHGVASKVTAFVGPSAEVLPDLPPVYDLVFIDGAHDVESVRRDATLAARLLRPGGLLVFHDFGREGDSGVCAAVDELIAAGARLVSRCETLAVVRPAVAENLALVGETTNG